MSGQRGCGVVLADGCEFFLTDDEQCGRLVVETLVFLNPNINSHVHAGGSLRTCADHLNEHSDAQK